MFKLIINELTKIFNKKSTYIILSIIFVFVFFTNYLYKYKLDEIGGFNNINYLDNALEDLEGSDEERSKAEYILNTKENINKVNDTRGILINFFNEYETIIIIFLIVISSSMIIDEYKGPIKNLLTTPNSRIKILLSKILTIFLLLMFVLVYILILQLLFGYIFFKFDSLKIPVVIYNFKIKNIITINVFNYLLILLINKLPLFLITIMILIFLGIKKKSSSLTSIITLVNYIVITPIVINSNIKLLNYFINKHWDLSIYLYGRVVEDNTLNFSIFMCIIYFILLFIASIIIFDSKDIKNM